MTIPTGRSLLGSTTTTHPIFSVTSECTTLESVSSGMAVTHFPAGIMNDATDGIAPEHEAIDGREAARVRVTAR